MNYREQLPSGTKRGSGGSGGGERMEKLNLRVNAFRNVMNANNTETVKGTLEALSESLIARSPVN
jgi:hypothetical protein